MHTSILQHLSQDRSSVLAYVGALAGVAQAENLQEWWMLIDHSKPKDNNTRFLFGSVASLWGQLESVNSGTTSVYLAPNTFAPQDESKRNYPRTKAGGKPHENNLCQAVRALWIDVDGDRLPTSFHLPPSLIVETTPPGLLEKAPEGKRQYIWLLKHETDVATASKLLKALHAHYKQQAPETDAAVAQVACKLRVPGFFNRKPEVHRLVNLLHCTTERYTYEDHAAVLRVSKAELKPTTKGKALEGFIVDNPSHEAASARYLQVFGTPSKSRTFVALQAFTEGVQALERSSTDWTGRKLFALALAAAVGCPSASEWLAFAVPLTVEALRKQDEGRGKPIDKRSVHNALEMGHWRGLENALKQASANSRHLTTTNAKHSQWTQYTDVKEQMEHNKITVVKALPGTGKTTCVKDVINSLPPNATVLVIAHRIALVEQTHGNSEIHRKLIKYSDRNPGVLFCPNLVVTVDSLHTLFKPGVKLAYDFVVLDEADALLSHLLTSTQTEVSNKRKVALDVLKGVLVNAGKVLALGADVSDLDVEVLTLLAQEKTTGSLLNTALAPVLKQITVVEKREQATAKIEQALAGGRKVFVACDERGTTEDLYNELQKQFPELQGTFINSRHKSHFTSVEDLYSYDYVIASPSLGTGFDITKVHFDTVVGIFENNESRIGYRDLNQALMRVRKATDVVVYVDSLSAGKEPTDQDLINRYRLGIAEVSLETIADYNVETGRYELRPFDSQVVQWQASYLQRKYAESCNRRAKLLLHLEAQGHTLVFDTKAKAETKVDIDNARKERKDREAQAIVDAPPIDRQTLDRLPKHNRTALEQAQADGYYKRLTLAKPWDAQITKDEVLWLSKVGDRVCRYTKLMRLTEQEALSENVAAIERKEGLMGDIDSKRSFETWQLLTQLWSLVPQDGKRYTSKDLLEFHKCLLQNKSLGSFLGVREVGQSKSTQSVAELARLLGYKQQSEQIGKGANRGKREYWLEPTAELTSLIERLNQGHTVEAEPKQFETAKAYTVEPVEYDEG